MAEKATIYDVAAAANVSTSTVSRVLNDSSKVAEPTRSRVRAVIRRLSYVPNGTARSLATGTVEREIASVEERKTAHEPSLADEADEPLLRFEGNWEKEECEIIRRAVRRRGDADTSWVLVKTHVRDSRAFIALKLDDEPYGMVRTSTAHELAARMRRA